MAKSATLPRKGKRRKAGRPSNYRLMTPEQALKAAVDHMLTDFGAAVVDIKKARSASPITGRLMCDYVQALVSKNGDCVVPDGLTDGAIVLDMQAAFVVACEEYLVGKPLRGQQTDWYDGAVAVFRAQRVTTKVA